MRSSAVSAPAAPSAPGAEQLCADVHLLFLKWLQLFGDGTWTVELPKYAEEIREVILQMLDIEALMRGQVNRNEGSSHAPCNGTARVPSLLQ